MRSPPDQNWYPEIPIEFMVEIQREIDSLGKDWFDKLPKKVSEHYDRGVARAFMKEMEKLLKQAGIPKRELAEFLTITPSAVSQWFRQNICIGGSRVIALMHKYPGYLVPLLHPDDRTRKERDVAGFIEGVVFVQRDVLKQGNGGTRLLRVQFAGLEHGFKNFKALERDRERMTEEILWAIEEEMSCLGENDRADPSRLSLGELMSRWGKAYLMVVSIMSFRSPGTSRRP